MLRERNSARSPPGDVRFCRGAIFFGRFSYRYRQAVAALRGVCRQKPPRSLAERTALVQKLEHAQQARRNTAAIWTYVQSALGPIWANTETRWQDARVLAAWTRAALSTEIGARQIIILAAQSADLSVYADYARRLERVRGTPTLRFSTYAAPSSPILTVYPEQRSLGKFLLRHSSRSLRRGARNLMRPMTGSQRARRSSDCTGRVSTGLPTA